jgi:hypothetical protein
MRLGAKRVFGPSQLCSAALHNYGGDSTSCAADAIAAFALAIVQGKLAQLPHRCRLASTVTLRAPSASAGELASYASGRASNSDTYSDSHHRQCRSCDYVVTMMRGNGR